MHGRPRQLHGKFRGPQLGSDNTDSSVTTKPSPARAVMRARRRVLRPTGVPSVVIRLASSASAYRWPGSLCTFSRAQTSPWAHRCIQPLVGPLKTLGPPLSQIHVRRLLRGAGDPRAHCAGPAGPSGAQDPAPGCGWPCPSPSPSPSLSPSPIARHAAAASGSLSQPVSLFHEHQRRRLRARVCARAARPGSGLRP